MINTMIMMKTLLIIVIINLTCMNFIHTAFGRVRDNNRERCPRVKPMRNFNINDMMGSWYIVQYYASSEEALEYACMQSFFTMADEINYITMNFTFLFENDPYRDVQQGNITWLIPNIAVPGHWIHAEDIYEGIYNTYVIDTDYKSWGLIMHCAEKSKSPKYLSALLLSREPHLGVNIINFLREKLPRYDIDISYMFSISQENCSNLTSVNNVKSIFHYENLN